VSAKKTKESSDNNLNKKHQNNTSFPILDSSIGTQPSPRLDGKCRNSWATDGNKTEQSKAQKGWNSYGGWDTYHCSKDGWNNGNKDESCCEKTAELSTQNPASKSISRHSGNSVRGKSLNEHNKPSSIVSKHKDSVNVENINVSRKTNHSGRNPRNVANNCENFNKEEGQKQRPPSVIHTQTFGHSRDPISTISDEHNKRTSQRQSSLPPSRNFHKSNSYLSIGKSSNTSTNKRKLILKI